MKDSRPNIRSCGTGFSLIEVLVTIGIFTLVSGIILASYPRFSSRLLFTRTLQDVAQSIRRAQTYSIGVRGAEGEAGFVFDISYGIYFSISDAMSLPEQKYVFFADFNDDKQYSHEASSELSSSETLDLLKLPKGIKIVRLCKGMETLPEDCTISQLSITYKRPAPTTYFRDNINPGVDVPEQDVAIVFEGPRPDNQLKEIIIWKTGQISIKDLPTP